MGCHHPQADYFGYRLMMNLFLPSAAGGQAAIRNIEKVKIWKHSVGFYLKMSN